MSKSEKIIRIFFVIILYVIVIILSSLIVKELLNKDDNKDIEKTEPIETEQIESNDNQNQYIKLSDIEDNNNLLDSSTTYNKINDMYYVKYVNSDNKIVISILEPNNITERTYNSLVSFVEFIKGKEEAAIFKENITSLNNINFNNYEIKINPVLLDNELVYYNSIPEFDLYKITQLFVSDSKPYNMTINDYYTYEGNNKSYDTVKEMMLRNIYNISSFGGNPELNHLELQILMNSEVTTDETKQDFVNNIIKTYLKENLTYNIKIENENNNLKIIIDANNL